MIKPESGTTDFHSGCSYINEENKNNPPNMLTVQPDADNLTMRLFPQVILGAFQLTSKTDQHTIFGR